jgi:F-type H+-transporting ATPase subunit epsilon
VAKTFQLDIVSPELVVWSGEAVFIQTKTLDGELGILADHEPLMGALATGAVEVESADGERTTIAMHGGFLQVLNNKVTLLTDRANVVEGDADSAREAASAMAKEESIDSETSESDAQAVSNL